MKITIASWNIGEDETHEKNVVGLDSYDFIKEMIEKYNIDIISFQEAITSSENMMPIKEYIEKNTDLKYSSSLETCPSHINIGSMMGVVTCSKFLIDKEKIVMFENPHIEYKKSDTVTWVMHDKGFIISYIDSLPLVITNGHGMPFFGFKRSALEFLDMFEKAEKELLEILTKEDNFIVLGDMNHGSFKEIFPKTYDITNSGINGTTYIHKGVPEQLDYIMTSKKIKINNSKIIDTRFDHKLCIVDIELK